MSDGKKLKIAVQLYGHLRTFRECALNLKVCILNHYDCDVFIHTWDTLDHTTKAWHRLNEGKDVVELNTEDIQKELSELYHPKGILIEKQDWTDLGNITDNNGQVYSIFAIRCMMQTMKRANALRVRIKKKPAHTMIMSFAQGRMSF